MVVRSVPVRGAVARRSRQTLGAMKFALAVVLALLSTLAHAVIDEVPDWLSLSMETVVDGQPVAVAARAKNGRLEQLTAKLAGKPIEVPRHDLDDLPALSLQSLRVVSPDVKSHAGPKVRVEFSSRSPAGSQVERSVQFHFFDFKYQGRVVERVEEGKLVRELKQPGQQPRSMK